MTQIFKAWAVLDEKGNLYTASPDKDNARYMASVARKYKKGYKVVSCEIKLK